MRLATFLAPGEDRPRSGDVQGSQVVSFEGKDVAELITLSSRPEPTGPSFALEDVQLLMPYRPRAVFMVGANYRLHVQAAAEVGKMPNFLAEGEIPMLMKGPGSPVGPYDDVVRPAAIKNLDYEGELMVIAGGGGSVAGYAVANDVSARDVGDKWQLTRHKGGDTFCPWGPWVTTADEVPDPYNLSLRTWVDGELRQDGNTSEMIVKVPEIIAYIQKTISVQAGDAVLTGTAAGTATEVAENNPWLEPGQTVRVELQGLGAIENKIVQG